MRTLIKGCILALATIVAVVGFAPKKELYYLLEYRLQKEGILISGERLHDSIFTLNLDGGTLIAKGIDVGKIEHASIVTMLLYNRIDLQGFLPSRFVSKFAPIRLRHARAEYALWHPTTIRLRAEGEIGSVEGSIDLRKHLVRLHWIKVGKIGPLRPYLKRTKEGWFYEYRF